MKTTTLQDIERKNKLSSCSHTWEHLYVFADEDLNYDVYFCIYCLKQVYKERSCPKDMEKIK